MAHSADKDNIVELQMRFNSEEDANRMFVICTIQQRLNLTLHRAFRLFDRILSLHHRKSMVLTSDLQLKCLRPELEKNDREDAKYKDEVRQDILHAMSQSSSECMTLGDLNFFLVLEPEKPQKLTPEKLSQMSQREVAEFAAARAGLESDIRAGCISAFEESGVVAASYQRDWTSADLRGELCFLEYFKKNPDVLDRVITELLQMKAEADVECSTADSSFPS
jgi:hypothetical protein